jgi:drug/metabolite transporter (DMT)-like permease
MMTPANRPMNAAEWGMLLFLSVLWGGSFVFNGVALADIPPLTVAFVRVAIAAVALLAVCRWSGIRLPATPAALAAFAGMGILNNVVPFSLILWGQTQIGSGLASILNATTPIFTVLAAHVLTDDEKLTPARIGGVLFGIVGVAVLAGPAALAGLDGPLPAQLACLGGALSYAFASIFGKRFRALGVPPLATAAGQLTASCVLLLPMAIVADRPWQLAAPGTPAILAVVGLAVFSSALAYVLFFRILATAGATNLVLVTLLIPASAMLLGALILGETPQPRDLAGLALIAAGLAIIDGRLVRRLNPAPGG